MEQYGTTIRQIRLRKGFSHKEIYSGILSKSFAIEFEKGRYDIKFDRMLSILDRLMISVEELLLIHNQYGRAPRRESLLHVDLERVKNDPSYADTMERQLREESRTDKTSFSRLQHAEIVALMCVYGSPDAQRSPEYQAAKNYIHRYLFDVETWTLSEFRIYSDMSFLFESGDVKTSLFLTAWETLEKYQAHPDHPIYLSHLLVNHLYSFICSKQYAIARKAVERLKELTADPNMLSWKVPTIYYDGLLDYASGKTQAGMAKIERAKGIYCLCGNAFMAEEMENGLQAMRGL